MTSPNWHLIIIANYHFNLALTPAHLFPHFSLSVTEILVCRCGGRSPLPRLRSVSGKTYPRPQRLPYTAPHLFSTKGTRLETVLIWGEGSGSCEGVSLFALPAFGLHERGFLVALPAFGLLERVCVLK